MTPAEQKRTASMDAPNQALTRAEQKLKGLRPVRGVWIKCEGGGDLGMVKTHSDKSGESRWRLVYANQEDETAGALTECPIEVRSRVAKFLPKLHEAIIEDKEKYVSVVDEALKAVEDYLTHDQILPTERP